MQLCFFFFGKGCCGKVVIDLWISSKTSLGRTTRTMLLVPTETAGYALSLPTKIEKQPINCHKHGKSQIPAKQPQFQLVNVPFYHTILSQKTQIARSHGMFGLIRHRVRHVDTPKCKWAETCQNNVLLILETFIDYHLQTTMNILHARDSSTYKHVLLGGFHIV